MADVDVQVSAGTGTSIRCFQKGSGDYDQYIRECRATAKGTLSNIPWAVTTTGLGAVIPTDVTRVSLIVTSAATGIVYVRFDGTIPVPATPAYDYLLNPGDRWEVPIQLCQLQQSWVGSVAGGSMLAIAGICA
jgi:hypothetical protein